ncbi:unnamed protein product [Effrenium voratum]|nr:unnamed protein product [Effrenium voratum]
MGAAPCAAGNFGAPLALTQDDLCQRLEHLDLSKCLAQQAARKARLQAAALRPLLESQDLARLLCLQAGLRSACRFAAVARSPGGCVARLLPRLRAEAVPAFYVAGGCLAAAELASLQRLAQAPAAASADPIPSAWRWDLRSPMPTERRWCAGAAVLGKVYVVGGQQDGHVLGTAERFDPETNSWEALPDMPTCREACAVASCGACLYVFGGCQHEVPLAIAERLQVAEPSAWWEGLENMPCSRDACAAAALNGRLYVMGGRSQGAFLRSADVLSASALSWSRLPSMPTARLGCSAAAGMRWVYVCGGHAGGGRALATVERFDVADYFWEAVEEMPSARLGAVSLCWQRNAELCVYVFGGHNGHGAVPVAERLCTDGDGFNLRWEVLPDMVTPTYACAGAAIAW